MASAKALARLHTLIWVLIYGGLLMGVMGLAVLRVDDGATGMVMAVIGCLAAAAGGVLIWVRSRLHPDR